MGGSRVWGKTGCLAASPWLGEHNTGDVPLAFLPKPQHTDGGEQKARMAHHVSAALPAFRSALPGLSVPSISLRPHRQRAPLPYGLTKDHAQNAQMLVQYGSAEKRAI